MYISAADRQFGAWRLDDTTASSGIRFSIFFPDRARDPSQFHEQPAEPPLDQDQQPIRIEGYGDPKIASIHVVGSFQTALGQPANWQVHPDNALQRAPHPSGWVWSLETPALPAGFHQYRYRLAFEDGTTREVADPCARYGGADLLRPTSAVVVGPSATSAVRPVAGGRRPLRELVVYELNIDDFTAELRGARAPLDTIHRLDLGGGGTALEHLAALGVNAILFLPWTAWNDDAFSWGYTPYSYFSVEHRYTHDLSGDPAEPETKQLSRLRDLVNACHDQGIHVLMDGVFNHVGPDQSARQTGFSYRWLYQDPAASPYAGRFGGTFPGLVDLDYHNGCAQQLVGDACRYWMDEFGIDGIRFDNATNFYLARSDGTPASQAGLPRLLTELRQHAADPAFSLTLEYIDLAATSVVSSTDATSYWSDALYGCCFETLWSGRVTPQLLSALDAHAWLASPDKVATTYLSNHDHSHVTWRCGARDDLGSMRWWRTQPWAIALLTSPGTPMLQNGQELGEDHWIPEDDQGSGRRVKARPLRWGYADDPIGRRLVALYRHLIGLRLRYAALRSDNFYPGRWETWQTRMNPQGYGLDTERQLAIYHRWGEGEDGRLQRFIIALNFSPWDQQVDLPFPADGAWTDLLPGGATAQVQGFWLRGWTVPSSWGCVFFQ